MTNIENLHKTFKQFGALALTYRQKCIGMLPEINRLRVYEKKGYGSIYEYAAKLADISREQVQRVLQLERKFEDKPALKNMLIKGEASVSKLAKIASIAAAYNEQELADRVKILFRSALETLAKDYRILNEQIQSGKISVPGNRTKEELCLSPARVEDPALAVAHRNLEENKINLKVIQTLSFENRRQLMLLAEKGIGINKLIEEMLETRVQKINEEKERIAKEILSENNSQNTHNIPVHIKKIVRQEHGVKCSISHCDKPANIIHHTQRFVLSHNHDPRFLAPLCREHHQLAHAVETAYCRVRACCGGAGSYGGQGVLQETGWRWIAGVSLPTGTHNPYYLAPYTKRAG